MAEKLTLYRLRELKRRRARFGLLADWYGSETAATEIAAHTACSIDINRAVEEVLRRLDISEIETFARIDSDWELLVGMPFCRLTRPERLAEKILYLSVRHSALIAELRPSLDLIVRRLNVKLGSEVVAEVRLTIAGGRHL